MAKELQPPKAGKIPTKSDEDEPAKMMDQRKFQPYDNMSIDEGGHDLGQINTQSFKFESEGDRILGILTDKRQINIEDNPWLYQLENGGGRWAVWGNTIIDSRLPLVPMNSIVYIEYIGKKRSQQKKRNYKDYKVKWFDLPEDFDRLKWTVQLAADGKTIEFVEAPVIDEVTGRPMLDQGVD